LNEYSTLEVFQSALPLAASSNVNNATEAVSILEYCLRTNSECLSEWQRLYEMNVKASAILLSHLCDSILDPKVICSPARKFPIVMNVFHEIDCLS
jgi:hypothetical protein